MPNQFGADQGLSTAESYAACGPAAAVAFARHMGRNPTLREATDLATRVGWTPGQGMAGPGSEQELLTELGIPSRLVQGPTPEAIIRDVTTGNPVILDTPGHYFYADDYDPQSGKFHVGNSGTAFKAGAPWLSLDEMGRLAGGVRAALFVDAAQGAPSVATAGGTAPQRAQAAQQVAPGGETAAPDVGTLADRFSASYGLDDPLVLRSLVQAESGGNPDAVGDNGNSIGLLQNNMAGGRGAGYSADWLRDPANNLRLGMPEIKAAYDAGRRQGLSGPDLAVYVGRMAQRPAEGLEAGYGDAYRALASGGAPSGPISPVSGPDYAPKLGMAAQLPDAGSGGGPPQGGTTPSPDNTGRARTMPNPVDLGASSGGPQNPLPVHIPSTESIDSLQAPAPPEAYGEQPPGPTLAQSDTSYTSPLRSGMEGLGQLGTDIGQSVSDTFGRYGTPAEQAGAYAMPAPGPHIINNSRLVLDALNYVINGVEPPPDSPARLRSLTAVQELNDVMGAAGEPIARTVVGGVQDALEGNAAGGYAAAQQRAEQLGPAGMLAIGLLNPTNFVPLPGGGKAHAAEDVIRAVAPEVADALAREVPQATETAAREVPPAFDRFYHGTGAAYETPDAARFDPNGLYGPAHYISNEPRVAATGDLAKPGYAEQAMLAGAPTQDLIDGTLRDIAGLRAQGTPEALDKAVALERWVAERAPQGAQVRPVDVPRDLKLLDMREPVDAATVQRVASVLPPGVAERFAPAVETFLAHPEFKGNEALYAGLRDAFNSNEAAYVQREGRSLYRSAADEANKALAAAGYDGIRYPGGKIMPLQDAAGRPVEHTALAIFPESMGKLRNALSGKAGGAASPALAIHAAGATVGGLGGYEATDPNATPLETASDVLGGAALGAGLAHVGTRAFRPAAGRALTGVPDLDQTIGMWNRQGQSSWARRMLDQIGGLPDAFETRMLDVKTPVNKATARVARVLGVPERMLPANLDATAVWADFEGRHADAAQKISGFLGTLVRKLPDEAQQTALNLYVKYLRDIEVAGLRVNRGAAPGALQFSGGVTSAADARARLAALEQHLGLQTWQRVQDAYRDYRGFLDGILDEKEQAGRIDPVFAQLLRTQQPNYTPAMLADAENLTLSGRGMHALSSGIRRLSELGHQADDLPPISAAVILAARETNANWQNLAKRTLVNVLLQDPKNASLVRRVPDIKLTTGTDIATQVPGTTVAAHRPIADVKGLIDYWDQGKHEWWQVPPQFEKLVKEGLKEPLVGPVASFFSRLNAVARMGITQKNPIFPFINAQADAINALAMGVRPDRIARGYAHAFAPNDSLLASYVARGGGMGGWHYDQESIDALVKQVTKDGGVALKDPAAAAEFMKRMATGLVTLKPVEWYGNKIEMAPRLAAYRKALGEGVNPYRAAMEGRRVTLDFSRMGTWMRNVNHYVLFSNAAVHGVAQLGRIVRDHPKAAVAVAGMLNATAIALYAHNMQYRYPDGTPMATDVPEYLRDTGLWGFIPGTEKVQADGKTRPSYWWFPLRELGVVVAPVNYLLQSWERTDPRSATELIQGVAGRTINPIPGGGGLGDLVGFAPGPVKTAMELYRNESSFTGLPVEKQSDVDRGIPKERRVQSYTSPTAIAATTTKLPILDASLADLGVSPAQAEYGARGVFGGLGQQVLGAADVARAALRGEDVGAGTNTLYRSTIGRLVRDQGGQIEANKDRAFQARLAQTKADAYETLKQGTAWQAATTEQQRNALIASENAKVEKDLLQQVGDEAPQYLQPRNPDRPARYDPRSVPPAIRSRYPDDYDLERAVNAAVQAVQQYRRARASRIPIAPPSREQLQLAQAEDSRAYQLWARQNRPQALREQMELQGIAEQATAGSSAP